jgi:tRNA(fMet)-specific endonuclease VapC
VYILDTDTLTFLFAGHPKVVSRQQRVPSAEIATSIVSRIESLQGRFDFLLKAATGEELLRAQSLLDGTIGALAQVESVFGIDEAAAADFDRLRQNKKLKKIGRTDLLIAAIALANHAILVTRNLKHFSLVPGLHLENWAD